VTIAFEVPGRARVELEHLLLDVNGTLTNRGVLLEGVAERFAALGDRLSLQLVSADTFGTLREIAAKLGAAGTVAADGQEKEALVQRLGPLACAVIGNGANDVAALRAAALGIAVLGPEGVSADALQAADIVCGSILDALDLLLDERALVATLRR
jgi:P-type E1-E2 ATPase